MQLNQPLTVRYRKLRETVIEPKYQSNGAAAFDLHANLDYNVSIRAGESFIIGTGLAFEIPPGYVGIVASRSGHGFSYDVTLANSIGVIDSDFRGEVMVKLINHNHVKDTGHILFIEPGHRIAQMFILPIPSVNFEASAELNDTQRGTNGFGSTGN